MAVQKYLSIIYCFYVCSKDHIVHKKFIIEKVLEKSCHMGFNVLLDNNISSFKKGNQLKQTKIFNVCMKFYSNITKGKFKKQATFNSIHGHIKTISK